jgi:hypothetical protein
MLSDYLIINFDKELLHRILISKAAVPNEQIKLIREKGLYLKPYHIVYKKTTLGEMEYRYYGEYWYKVVYQNKKRRLIYIGKSIPSDLGIKISIPIKGFSFVAYRHKKSPVFIKKSVYSSFSGLLKSFGL